MDLALDTQLGWAAGALADIHHIYLGTDSALTQPIVRQIAQTGVPPCVDRPSLDLLLVQDNHSAVSADLAGERIGELLLAIAINPGDPEDR